VTREAQPLVAKLKAIGADLIDEAFADIDAGDLETARRVLEQIRENVSRAAATNRASNE
jgi:hypothetical protein